MSLFSGLKKLARKAIKVIAPSVIATIPIVGPIAATAVRGVLVAKAASKAVTKVKVKAVPVPGRPTLPGGAADVFGSAADRAWHARVGRQFGTAADVKWHRTVATLRPGAGFAKAAPVIRGGSVPTKFVQKAGPPGPVGVQQMSIFSAIPAITRVIGAAVRSPAGRAVVGTAAVAGVADIVFDEFGNPVRRKRRRMNYGNAKATKRAIRRIKGSQKMLKDIEKLLPRRSAPRRRRDLPEGHTHVR